MSAAIRCARCGRRLRSSSAEGWNATMRQGVAVGYTCPDCQTGAEHIEAMVNESTTNYSVDADGRVWGSAR